MTIASRVQWGFDTIALLPTATEVTSTKTLFRCALLAVPLEMCPAFVLDAAVGLAGLIDQTVLESNSEPPCASQDRFMGSDSLPVHPAPSSTWDDHNEMGADDTGPRAETSRPPEGYQFQ